VSRFAMLEKFAIAPEKQRFSPYLRDVVAQLEDIFRTHEDKYEAHRRAAPLLERLTYEPLFLSNAIEQFVSRPGVLEKKHYPVPAIPIVLTPYFELVINCWIPLPDRSTHLSTKAIHHHGKLLLTTATLFGAGYEHLLFDAPVRRQTEKDLWRMKLVEAAPHPAHHVAFVDAHVAHVPMYPAELSLTLALWSSNAPTSTVDWMKRIPVVQENASALRSVASRLGLRRQLDLNVVEYFDFYPSEDGFVGMRERQEFPLGPNENYLKSLFHTIQATGNSKLAPLLRRRLEFANAQTREVGNKLVDDLEHDRPIEGVLSPGHYDLPHANFTRAMIDHALSMQ
jgi:hypothetical protein